MDINIVDTHLIVIYHGPIANYIINYLLQTTKLRSSVCEWQPGRVSKATEFEALPTPSSELIEKA